MVSTLLALTFLTVPDFDVFFETFSEKRAGIQVLEAQFTQRTILPDEILTTEGSLLYAQPRRIVFRTEDPQRTTLIDADRGYEYEPPIKQMTIFDLADNPETEVFFVAFEHDITQLRDLYEVTLFDIMEDDRGKQGLLIKPKADQKNPTFEEISIYLRDSDWLPYRIRIVNDPDSQLIIDFTAYQINHAPKPEKTQIFLSEGVKVIENDRVVDTVGKEGKYLPGAMHFAKEKPDTAASDTSKTPAPTTTPPAQP